MKFKGHNMTYVKEGTFTTQEMSMLETLQELQDVIDIAKMFCDNKNDTAYKNLDFTKDYIAHLRKKIKIALEHIPDNIKKQEYL